MIPTIQIEEAQFTEVAERVADHEIGDGVRLAAENPVFVCWGPDGNEERPS